MATEEQINKGIETQDELAQITAEQLLEELENDVQAYEKAVEKAEKDLANYTEQLAVDEQLWAILEKPGSVRKLQPTHEYETDENWFELMHQKQLYQLRQDRAVAEGTVKQLKATVEGAKEAQAKTIKKLEEFKANNLDLIARRKRNGGN